MVKKSLYFVILLTFFSCGNFGPEEEDDLHAAFTKLFHENNFDIAFPKDAIIKVDSSVFNKISFSSHHDRFYFEVSKTLYPDNMYHSDSLDMIQFDLEYTQQQFFRNNPVTLGRTFVKSCAGYPGKEFSYIYRDTDLISNRIVYIVKNIVFEIVFESPATDQYDISGSDFMDSFELIGIPENEEPFLNLPSDEELDNPPYHVNFTGETQRVTEITETQVGLCAGVFEGQEFMDNDPAGLKMLGVGYVIFPENTEIDVLKEHMSQAIASGYILDPSFAILEDIEHEEFRKVTCKRKISDMIFSDLRKYYIHDNYLFYVNAMVLEGGEKDARIVNFFNSFKVKN